MLVPRRSCEDHIPGSVFHNCYLLHYPLAQNGTTIPVKAERIGDAKSSQDRQIPAWLGWNVVYAIECPGSVETAEGLGKEGLRMDQARNPASRSRQRSVPIASQRPAGADVLARNRHSSGNLRSSVVCRNSGASIGRMRCAPVASFMDLHGDDKPAVLRAIVNSLALPPNSDRDSLAQLLAGARGTWFNRDRRGDRNPSRTPTDLLNTSSPVDFAVLSREASRFRRFRRPTGLCDFPADQPNRPHASASAFATVVCVA